MKLLVLHYITCYVAKHLIYTNNTNESKSVMKYISTLYNQILIYTTCRHITQVQTNYPRDTRLQH